MKPQPFREGPLPTMPSDATDPAARRWFKPAAAVASVACDIDFGHDGRQLGHLTLAEPLQGPGWRTLAIPLACLRNGEGPTLLLLGGTHGDEVEGPVALLRLLRELGAEDFRGRVIVIPALNYPAVAACRRTAPSDGLDLNRCFPGRAEGSFAEVLAHYLDSVLLPLCDLVLDLHAGGQQLRYLPSLWLLEGPEPALWQRTLAAARAFGAPLVTVSASLGGDMSESSARHGCVYLSSESGGGASVDPAILAQYAAGIRRLMAHLGMTPAVGEPPPPSALQRVAEGDHVLAPTHGLFEPAASLGDRLAEGDLIGWLHPLEQLAAPSLAVRAPRDGLLYGLRWLAQARRDAVLATLARPE